MDTSTPFVTAFGYRQAIDGTATPVVSSISHGGENISVSYHDDGNIQSITTAEGMVSYNYDSLGQLIRVNDAVEGKTFIYTYDAGFNMTSEKEYAYTTEEVPSGSVIRQRNFVYSSTWKDQMISCDGKTMTYDGVGNLLSYDGNSFTWTGGRRLSCVTKADGTVITYEYDHEGRRIKKMVGNVEETFTYVGDILFGCERLGRSLRFSYDSVGNPAAVMYNGVEYYYVKNLQGDIIGLVDGSGAWVVRYRYDAWGRVLSVTGNLAATLGQDNPLRYRGYFYDVETGFYYVSSRYYAPEVGRFISADTESVLFKDFENLIQYNLYAYCWNNPVNMMDAEGYWPVQAFIIGAAFGGVFGGLSAITNGESVLAGVITGAVVGATTGWILASGLVTGVKIAVSGVVAAAGDIVNQACNLEENITIKNIEETVDWSSVVKTSVSAVIAAPISIITGYGIQSSLIGENSSITKKVADILLDTILSSYQSSLQWIFEQAIGGKQ